MAFTTERILRTVEGNKHVEYHEYVTTAPTVTGEIVTGFSRILMAYPTHQVATGAPPTIPTAQHFIAENFPFVGSTITVVLPADEEGIVRAVGIV